MVLERLRISPSVTALWDKSTAVWSLAIRAYQTGWLLTSWNSSRFQSAKDAVVQCMVSISSIIVVVVVVVVRAF